MARRKHSGELNIGSDSFLDVLANIVGILIILIVVAAVRASRAPAPAETVHAAESADAAQDSAPPELIPPMTVTVPLEDEEEPDEPDFVEQTEPSAELAQKIRTVQEEIRVLEAEAQRRDAEKRDIEQRQARGELQISAGRNTLLKEKSAYESRNRTADELQALIASQKSSLNLLQTQLDEVAKQPPKTKAIKHRVTPISRVVIGEQLHFRISNNRVSQVPIHELLQAAMRHAKRHAESLLQNKSQVGTVGPIGGYLLQYKLEALPAAGGQLGPGMVRIALTSFQLQPESDLRDESVEEALTRGSVFDIAVQTADPGSTFTLWVYPDSFPTYRKLQNRLHDANIIVAGRPLPLGVPIAGSPDGSASAGQ